MAEVDATGHAAQYQVETQIGTLEDLADNCFVAQHVPVVESLVAGVARVTVAEIPCAIHVDLELGGPERKVAHAPELASGQKLRFVGTSAEFLETEQTVVVDVAAAAEKKRKSVPCPSRANRQAEKIADGDSGVVREFALAGSTLVATAVFGGADCALRAAGESVEESAAEAKTVETTGLELEQDLEREYPELVVAKDCLGCTAPVDSLAVDQ
jgi:hypothetical protein